MKKLILLLIIIGFGSCSADAPKMKLNRAERGVIDSLYSQQLPGLDSLMDSLCTVKLDTDYQRLKDSIISIRLKEIEAIRNQ